MNPSGPSPASGIYRSRSTSAASRARPPARGPAKTDRHGVPSRSWVGSAKRRPAGHALPVVSGPALRGDLGALFGSEDRARRIEHRLDPHPSRANRRHVSSLPLLHQGGRRDEDDAERRSFGGSSGATFMIDTVRHGAAPSHEHRPPDVVYRLSSHRLRLAELPHCHRARVSRDPQRPSEEVPLRQRTRTSITSNVPGADLAPPPPTRPGRDPREARYATTPLPLGAVHGAATLRGRARSRQTAWPSTIRGETRCGRSLTNQGSTQRSFRAPSSENEVRMGAQPRRTRHCGTGPSGRFVDQARRGCPRPALCRWRAAVSSSSSRISGVARSAERLVAWP